MSAKTAVKEGIKKARRAFFMHSSQVFKGSLNPVSEKAIFEICVLPVLLYGSENWILNSSKLEQFQGEIGRRGPSTLFHTLVQNPPLLAIYGCTDLDQ